MFWGATLQLTQEGEQQVEHVVATLFRGIQVRGGGGVEVRGVDGYVWVCISAGRGFCLAIAYICGRCVLQCS